jgi:hypothetical protein
MPYSPRKARVLLKEKKARVVQRTPFTIQLTIATGETKQDITLGVDAGSKTIGLSATTDKEELFSAEVKIRTDIVKLLATRRQNRKAKRNRLRYRKARFDNRKKGKGWLAPSVRNKIDTHLKVVALVHKLLPITKTIVETASFDIQKIRNPEIFGTEYQQGEQLSFWNTRAYVLHRDNHKCQGKKSCTNKILNVHHIESRKTGGNAPNNLITLCEECHKEFHNGTLKLKLKRGQSFKDAAFMGIMRWAFYNKLKELYPNVSLTYGYITKNTRIENNLSKEHRIDALCITGNPLVKRADNQFVMKQTRRHNRQIHKAKILKGGKKKNNQAQYKVFGFQLFDKVKYEDQECFIFGRRNSGNFDIRKLDGIKINASVSYKKLKFLETRKSLLIGV